MGFIFGDKSKGTQNTILRQKKLLEGQSNAIKNGTGSSMALDSFDQGLGQAQNSQRSLAVSGFGGNTGNRLRNLDNAQSDLAIQGNTARDILELDEIDRINKLKDNYGLAAQGAQAQIDQNTGATIGAVASGASSIFDTFMNKGKKV